MPNPYDLFKGFAPWAPAAGRLLSALFATVVGFVIIAIVIRRPKSTRPATWAQCMAGAVAVFAMFLLCYAIVPSEWLNFANGRLDWSTDKIFLGIKSSRPMPLFNTRWPITIPMSTVRDTVAALIYVVFFGVNLALWSMWQKRPVATEPGAETGEKVVGTSRFGRPVKAKA